jgi:hypothetical protein
MPTDPSSNSSSVLAPVPLRAYTATDAAILQRLAPEILDPLVPEEGFRAGQLLIVLFCVLRSPAELAAMSDETLRAALDEFASRFSEEDADGALRNLAENWAVSSRPGNRRMIPRPPEFRRWGMN